MRRNRKHAAPKPSNRKGFYRWMVRIGMSVTHSLAVLFGLLWRLCMGFFLMLWYMLRQVGRFFAFLGKSIAGAFTEHNASANAMMKDVKKSRKEGGKSFFLHILRFVGMYIFGEHGILRTGFNYIMPVISMVFLFAIVRYGMGLDYAISVVCNGEELGIITAESEFEAAEEEVIQRISNAGKEVNVAFHPTYTLKIVSEEDQYVDVQTLANKLLQGSNASLCEAYGVYVDGEFIGAVENKDVISARMDENLAEYATSLDDLVNEVFYTKEVTYQYGIYLTDSVCRPTQLLNVLLAETETVSTYIVQENDTPPLIAAKHDMTLEELEDLNPQMHRGIVKGMTVKVMAVERYIPIAHTKLLTLTSMIDYESVDVETSALNLGVTKVISKGVMGEKTSEVLVTYVDGTEDSRKVQSAVITKQPIPEQVGIGTYSPAPADASTVIAGTGMFGWPVGGGYISDNYISDRNHKGIDIAAPYGTEIYASGPGTVVAAGWNSGGYGNYVIIEHADNYRTLYAHCSVVIAVEGQQVEKGQLIAYVGSTGNSSGNHCHFEVRINNICTNPNNYLRVNAD